MYCCQESPQFPAEPLTHLKNAMDMILSMNHADQRPESEKIIREIDMALFSLDPGTGEKLETLLIEDTTFLPNGDGLIDRDRQIVEIDESEYPDDPLKAFGGRNRMSKKNTYFNQELL